MSGELFPPSNAMGLESREKRKKTERSGLFSFDMEWRAGDGERIDEDDDAVSVAVVVFVVSVLHMPLEL